MARGLRAGLAAFGAVIVFEAPAAEPLPLAGCYERVYDSAHLKAHRGQIVRRVKLKIGPTSMPKSEPGDKQPIVADAILQMWLRGESASFDSLGACWAEGEGLICNASVSAAEIDICKSKKDGVRDCRMDLGDAGSFQLAPKPEGVLVTVRERLELPQSGSDVGPYLYLTPDNVENHAFFAKAAPEQACK